MPENASILRRFGAILYDTLLLFALMMLGTLPFIAVRAGEHVTAGNLTYQLSLVAIAWLFFVGFWTYKGRTLGMQSWGLQLECGDGSRPGIMRSSVRFLAAVLSWLPAGLGFWWQILDREGLAWHDRISATRLRYYPRQPDS